MENSLYTEFDREIYGTRTPPDADGDYRTAFQQDRDRLIHTSAFRRLQAKTQMFKPGEYDFYRTRLTHSLEVAQIGRSIGNFLLYKGGHLSEGFHLDQDLVEAAASLMTSDTRPSAMRARRAPEPIDATSRRL